MRYLIILQWVAAVGVNAAPIVGFRASVNHTGFDTRGAVYVPFDSTGTEGHLKTAQVDVLASLAVKGGRDMDWLQVVTNETTTWATRTLNDFSDKGITYETDINAANQLRARMPDYQPWINSPLLADTDHDRQLGKLWGQRFTGKVIRFGKGNEVWNIFGTNLPAQNLFAARADPSYQGGDAEKAQRRQGHRLALAVTAFKQGLLDAGRADVTVIMEVEGFSPVAAFAGYQLDEMKRRGFDPKALNARLAIGQYAAGSATDFAVGSTNSQRQDAALSFINQSLVPWTLAHRQLAVSEGLVPVVDAYEMRIGQYPDASWIPFQYTAEQRAIQESGIRALFDASGGAGAFLNMEGVYGFPWNSSNQFSLLDLNRDFSSQAYQGVLGLTDFGSVPEPAGWGIVGALVLKHLQRRHRGL